MVALRGAPPFLGAKIKSKIDIFHLPPPKLSSVVPWQHYIIIFRNVEIFKKPIQS
jgi:hypothetical protein